MSFSRRSFLKKAALGTAGASLMPSTGLSAALAFNETRIVVLHTNDSHSRINPFPMDGGRNQGLGGAARRATLIKNIRRQYEHVLLLDSGDIFQGTPYFNLFGGELEFKLMSKMKYDVATLGNHDFDNGVDGFARMMNLADFQFVSANYNFDHSELKGRIEPWTTRDLGGVKVGIFGLGIDFDGLVDRKLHEGVTYEDPIAVAQNMVKMMRGAGCDLIICLSHLGYRYRNENMVSDQTLAAKAPEIDLILGGHTHTFMDEPQIEQPEGHDLTMINQVGWAGIRLGRIDLVFDHKNTVTRRYAANLTVDSRYDFG